MRMTSLQLRICSIWYIRFPCGYKNLKRFIRGQGCRLCYECVVYCDLENGYELKLNNMKELKSMEQPEFGKKWRTSGPRPSLRGGLLLLMTTLLLAVPACGVDEIDERKPEPVLPPYLEDDSKVPVTYVLAFDYAEGYDWHSDRDYGESDCNMLLFADGRKVKKIPVGYSYNLLPEVDMHRIVGGRVYSDYSTDTHTIIFRDGVELFRYAAREQIVAMEVYGEDVYTVGCSREGEGFSARKNGVAIVESATGSPFVHSVLSEDGTFSFCYCEPIKSGNEFIGRYYRFSTKDGKNQIAVRSDIVKVWDAVPGVGYVASLVGINAPVLFHEDGSSSVVALGVSAREIELRSCRFVNCSSPALMEITVAYNNLKSSGAHKHDISFPSHRSGHSRSLIGGLQSVGGNSCNGADFKETECSRKSAYLNGGGEKLVCSSGGRNNARAQTWREIRGVWKETSCVMKWENARKAYGFFCDDDGTVCGVSSGSGSDVPDIAYVGLMGYTLPGSYAVLAESAVDSRADSLVVGLSSRLGEKPVVWSPHCADTLDINGFIASVKLDMVEKVDKP